MQPRRPLRLAWRSSRVRRPLRPRRAQGSRCASNSRWRSIEATPSRCLAPGEYPAPAPRVAGPNCVQDGELALAAPRPPAGSYRAWPTCFRCRARDGVAAPVGGIVRGRHPGGVCPASFPALLVPECGANQSNRSFISEALWSRYARTMYAVRTAAAIEGSAQKS
jgi:hypothetical protein